MAVCALTEDVDDLGDTTLHTLFGLDGCDDVHYLYDLHDELYSLGILHHGGYFLGYESHRLFYTYRPHACR